MPRFRHLLLPSFIISVTAVADVSYERLDWVPREALPASQLKQLPGFCSGTYLPPSLTIKEGEALYVEADHADFKEQGATVLSGNVLLEQKDRKITGDQATYEQATGAASFNGNIQFRADGLVMLAESLDYNAQTGYAHLENAHYVIAPIHMRGEANHIRVEEAGIAVLDGATYTFCEPGQNDWDIRASEFELDQNAGWGEVYHGRLRVLGVPVFYVPYYRFPITDKRMTGFLDPTLDLNMEIDGFGVNDFDISQAGFRVFNVQDAATPFYINIAPNYDDTITPRYVRDHGVLWENEFRYLNILGEGSISGAYLGNDWSHDKPLLVDADGDGLVDDENDDYRLQERWAKALRHSGKIGRYWSDRIHYDEVSDIDYIDDFKRSGQVNRTSHLKQSAELEYNDGRFQLLNLVESSQTVDEDIADSNKPFRRLPQVTFSKLNSYETNQLNYEFTSEATRFTRSNFTLSGVDKMNAQRFHNDITLSYPLESSWGFVTPKVQTLHTQYRFNNLDETAEDEGYTEDHTRNISVSSLDAGIYLERSFSWFDVPFMQTLEPRILYAHIPYVDQSDIPLFDTTETSFSYANLFSPNRFTGHDRVGDTEQVTLGVTSRFINDLGSEVFRVSLGQVLYFKDRQVALNPGIDSLEAAEQDEDNLVSSSPFAGEVEWRFTSNWRWKTDVQYNPRKFATTATERDAGASEERFEKVTSQLNYQNEDNLIFDMSYTHVEAEQKKQLGAAFFAPLNDSWALYGQQKRDVWNYRNAETREALQDDNRFIIEGLGGIEYQNCCWRVQMSYEEHTNTDKTKDYLFMFQIHLKGLGIFGRRSDETLAQRINGYDQRQIHDY